MNFFENFMFVLLTIAMCILVFILFLLAVILVGMVL